MTSSLYKYTRFLSIQILFLSCLFSCNNKQVPPTLHAPASPNNPPQILYITLEAVKDSASNLLQIKFIQQIVVNGALKTGNNIPANTQSNSWTISMLNEQDQLLSSVIIANPLIRELEYTDEAGQFKRKTIQVTRAEIPLRFNYNTGIKKIKVEEKGNNQSSKTLFSSALTLTNQ